MVKVFVAERRWEPCGGLELTDAMEVTIAGHACLLLLGMRHDYFSHVPSILVYPSIFLMPAEKYTYLSSRIIKEISRLGGNVNAFVPASVAAALREKLAARPA